MNEEKSPIGVMKGNKLKIRELVSPFTMHNASLDESSGGCKKKSKIKDKRRSK